MIKRIVAIIRGIFRVNELLVLEREFKALDSQAEAVARLLEQRGVLLKAETALVFELELETNDELTRAESQAHFLELENDGLIRENNLLIQSIELNCKTIAICNKRIEELTYGKSDGVLH